MFYNSISLYNLADDSVAPRLKPSLLTWNSWFMSGPGHLCSVAGMQGISKTPPLLVLPHANKWSRRLVGQMKAHRCSHCRAGKQNVRNVRGEKINPFYPSFCQSVALSFLSYRSCLPFPSGDASFSSIIQVFCLSCVILFLELTLSSVVCTHYLQEMSQNRKKWIYLCYNFKNTNMHSVVPFEIVMWQINYVTNKIMLC